MGTKQKSRRPTLKTVSTTSTHTRCPRPRGLIKPIRMLIVKNLCGILTIAVFSAVAPVVAAEPSAADPDLVQFRQAYMTGSGLAYVVIKDEKGDKVYRYGDASRQAAQKDTRGYMLFTCNLPHVFVVQNPPDTAALQKARVVKWPARVCRTGCQISDQLQKSSGQICPASDEVAASLGASPNQVCLQT